MCNIHTLSVKNLSASYSDYQVLSDVSFEVTSGSIICLTGPNGSGKSTLLSLMAGLVLDSLKITTDKKNIRFDTLPVLSLSRKEIAKHIAYMLQNETIAWNYTVRDIVVTGRYAHTVNGRYTESDYAYAEKIIRETEIESLAERRIFSLSGGEMQKVRIARSLAQEPEILLLDEPAASLDFGYQTELLEFIRNLAHNKKIGIAVSIHDLNTASRFADTIALLPRQGRIISGSPAQTLTPENLYNVYGCRFGTFIHPSYNCTQVFTKQ